MKYSTMILSALALSVTEVVAFPAAMFDLMARAEDFGDIDKITAAIKAIKEKRVGPLDPGFDPATQYVSTEGEHAFIAPDFAAGDQRGPCPGLNAMANHGYLPRNGVGTIEQFTTQTNRVFGMGLDLSAFLAVYGAVYDGDLTAWSIGGPSPALPLSPLSGLLGRPEGITNSHNKYESDVSPTRPDLYEYGNDYKVILSQFEDLFSRQPDPATANYDLDILTDFRADRFQQSISSNPYFFNGPFSGVAVQPAAYTFIYRFMSNKSAEYPEGILNQDVLKSFFSITGSGPGDFVWTEGNERIPDNWYKRAIGDEYTIPYFMTDLQAAAMKYPQFLNVGGNTGTVNTFTGIDFQNFTGGVYNLETLLQGDNALCFAYQASQQGAPDILKGLYSNVETALGTLNNAFAQVFAELSCPQLANIDMAQLAAYPGATGAY